MIPHVGFYMGCVDPHGTDQHYTGVSRVLVLYASLTETPESPELLITIINALRWIIKRFNIRYQLYLINTSNLRLI